MNARTVLHVRCHRISFEVYRELFGVLGDISPVVQALPPDSALVDITGALKYFRRTPAQLADLLQTRIAARYGLTVTVSGGPNRMIAGIAADTCPPGGVRIVENDPDAVRAFLDPQPVLALPGVGPALAKTLGRYGLETVGDLRALPPVTLQRIAGAGTARLLAERARGIDPRRVSPTPPPDRPRPSPPSAPSTATSWTRTRSARRCCPWPSSSAPGCASRSRSPAPSSCRSPTPTAPAPPAPGH